MATKTEEGAGAGTAARSDGTPAEAGTAGEERTPGTKGPDAAAAGTADARADATARTEEETGEESGEVTGEDEAAPAAGAEGRSPSGVGQGAAAVVSAALGLVSLTGGWIGTVAGAREQLVGQLRTSTGASVATQLKEVYADSWHTTALWAGLFALTALITGVVVLARPAFGAPGRPQAAWIKSVAWAGVSLGVIGLLLAVLKYSDALINLPSAG
ncbi:hypothetical protein SAMN05216532_5785 [Streptomyces sp. 2231.1]|uniref:hypothetical protein n=1 Tax=Streptomyces sp. 2231.1 TaxID=1855347 RepID=UPI0008982A4D|nr:hypothetical protein [Streptomyces sp. 2231.1]SED80659.1 hypothetical protein SAMN05216532_5785 [Streptomyces sp. 2231.1]